MPVKTKRWNEENTVEHPIISWLQTPELGWRFENQVAVNASYRTDEVEVLLLPILRQKLHSCATNTLHTRLRVQRAPGIPHALFWGESF
jgi:hypothetical protein